MSRNVMCWCEVPKEIKGEIKSPKKSQDISVIEIINQAATIGRVEAKKSAAWQEDALKRTVRV